VPKIPSSPSRCSRLVEVSSNGQRVTPAKATAAHRGPTPENVAQRAVNARSITIARLLKINPVVTGCPDIWPIFNTSG
jgi:hypothetical protein